MQTSLGFIGGGKMTNAIIGGLVADLEYCPELWVSNRGADKLAALAADYGINPAASNSLVIEQCPVVVLAVKPQVLQAVLEPLAPLLKEHRPLIISLAAGIKSATIEQWCGTELAIIRVMPNTPSIIRQGASGVFANAHTTAAQREQTAQLLRTIGIVCWVNDESQIDLVTAVSGSGPAYFMLFIESIIEAAVRRGLFPDTAKELALQTAAGTANMIAQSKLPLSTMIDDMLLPGGTTEQAVATFRKLGLADVVEQAVAAANERAQELAAELSD